MAIFFCGTTYHPLNSITPQYIMSPMWGQRLMIIISLLILFTVTVNARIRGFHIFSKPGARCTYLSSTENWKSSKWVVFSRGMLHAAPGRLPSSFLSSHTSPDLLLCLWNSQVQLASPQRSINSFFYHGLYNILPEILLCTSNSGPAKLSMLNLPKPPPKGDSGSAGWW